MTEQTTLPKDDPRMVAWEAYKRTDEYFNTKQWATVPEHTEGSLWAAFVAGFTATAASPTPRSGGTCACGHERGEHVLDQADRTLNCRLVECDCDEFVPTPQPQPSGGVPTSVPTLTPRADVERLADDLECSTAPIKNQAARMLRQLRRERDQLHAAAVQGAEDTRRLDFLERDVLEGEDGAMILHNGLAMVTGPMRFRGLGFGPGIGRSLREALDCVQGRRPARQPRPEGQETNS